MSKKPEEAETTEAIAQQNTAIAAPEIDLLVYAGQGTENIDQNSIAIPFIKLLQSNSPELDTIDSAKAGMFLNTVTGEVSRIAFMIPCFYNRCHVRWAPRSTGKGYQGQYKSTDIETGNVDGLSVYDQGNHPIYLFDVPTGATPFDDKGKPLYDEARDTRNHYVLVNYGGESFMPAIFPLTSTGIKHSKRWNSKMNAIEVEIAGGKKIHPPSFAYCYEVTSKLVEKAGNKWYEPEIKLHTQVVNPEIFQLAVEFYKNCSIGAVKANPIDTDDSEKTGDNLPF